MGSRIRAFDCFRVNLLQFLTTEEIGKEATLLRLCVSSTSVYEMRPSVERII